MIETVSGEDVEQVTDGDHRVRLRKEIVRLTDGVPLVMVRKHLPDGATRPPVLLVHGFAQNRYTWHTSRRSMSAWLAEAGYDVYNLELRGHGRSREAGQNGAERFSDYVGDVIAAADAIGRPAFWIGHSLGGAALYAAASVSAGPAAPVGATRPAGLIGIGALYYFGRSNPLMNALTRLTHNTPALGVLGRINLRTKLLGQIVARLYGLSDATGYAVPLSGWWPGSVEPELLEERLVRGFDWTSFTVWQEMSRWSIAGAPDFDEAWRATDVPLLVALGDKDHLLPPEDGRAAYERAGSSDRTLKIFDDWHDEVHWGHLDLVLGRHAPKHVWPFIEAWMRKRSGPA